MILKKSPTMLAMFNIIITVGRVATYVSVGLSAGWTGWPFAVALAISVFISGYAVSRKMSHKAGWAGLIFFGLIDLWFNEVELIRVLSAIDILPPTSTFLSLSYDDLVRMMQWSALLFGAVPTISAMILGSMQSGFDKQWPTKDHSKDRERNTVISGKKNGRKGKTKYDWRRLSDRQKDNLIGKDTRKIMEENPDMDERTALNWSKNAETWKEKKGVQ